MRRRLQLLSAGSGLWEEGTQEDYSDKDHTPLSEWQATLPRRPARVGANPPARAASPARRRAPRVDRTRSKTSFGFAGRLGLGACLLEMVDLFEKLGWLTCEATSQRPKRPSEISRFRCGRPPSVDPLGFARKDSSSPPVSAKPIWRGGSGTHLRVATDRDVEKSVGSETGDPIVKSLERHCHSMDALVGSPRGIPLWETVSYKGQDRS